MDNFITIKDFANKVGVTHQAIYDLILKDRLPSTEIVGKKVIDLDNEEVKHYLTNKGISIK